MGNAQTCVVGRRTEDCCKREDRAMPHRCASLPQEQHFQHYITRVRASRVTTAKTSIVIITVILGKTWAASPQQFLIHVLECTHTCCTGEKRGGVEAPRAQSTRQASTAPVQHLVDLFTTRKGGRKELSENRRRSHTTRTDMERYQHPRNMQEDTKKKKRASSGKVYVVW